MPLELHHYKPCKKDIRENLEFIATDKFEHEEGFLKKYKKFIYPNEYNDADNELCCKPVGFQEKGVRKEFYEVFKNNTTYFTLDEIEKMYKYLTTDQLNKQKHLQKNFRENFIANFREGESFVLVSW